MLIAHLHSFLFRTGDGSGGRGGGDANNKRTVVNETRNVCSELKTKGEVVYEYVVCSVGTYANSADELCSESHTHTEVNGLNAAFGGRDREREINRQRAKVARHIILIEIVKRLIA